MTWTARFKFKNSQTPQVFVQNLPVVYVDIPGHRSQVCLDPLQRASLIQAGGVVHP